MGFIWAFAKRLKDVPRFARPFAGSVMAVLIMAVGHFPFRLVAIALPLVILMGFIDLEDGISDAH